MKKNYAVIFLAGGLMMFATALMSQTTKPASSTQTNKPAASQAKKPVPAAQSAGGLKASLDRGKEVYMQQCLA